jgi:hypothetical protein
MSENRGFIYSNDYCDDVYSSDEYEYESILTVDSFHILLLLILLLLIVLLFGRINYNTS